MEFWKRVLIDIILSTALTGLFAGTEMSYITSVWIVSLVSFVLAILNAAIKPILVILSLPINILILGLFSVVISGIMLQLTPMLAGSTNFHLSSFGSVILIAIITATFNAVTTSHEDGL